MNEKEKETIEFFKECILKDHLFEEDLTLSYVKNVLNLLEKKDKIIDEMAEWIEKHTKYYDEDGCYCEVKKEICDKDIECKACIKQYFKNKVEEDK